MMMDLGIEDTGEGMNSSGTGLVGSLYDGNVSGIEIGDRQNDSASPTPERDEDLAKVEIATLSVILIIAIAGNGLMLVALRKVLQARPMSRIYFFMLNLSVADLLVAVGNIFPQLCWDITFRFQGPDLLCRVVKFLQVFVLYLSSYILSSMALDRYLVICHRTFSRNYYGALKGPKILILASYIFSFILASPQAFIFSMKEIVDPSGKRVMECWVHFEEPWEVKSYVTFFVFFAFLFPLLIIGFSYGGICLKVMRFKLPPNPKLVRNGRVQNKEKSLTPSNSSETEERDSKIDSDDSDVDAQQEEKVRKGLAQRNALRTQISRARIKTLKMTLIIVICFFVCWAPFCFTQMFMAFSPMNIGPAHVIMVLLASLNSCCNPWIYLTFSDLRARLGLVRKRGSDNDDKLGNVQMRETPRVRVYGPQNQDLLDLPNKRNLNKRSPAQTAMVRNSPPTEHCDHKPETKSDIV